MPSFTIFAEDEGVSQQQQVSNASEPGTDGQASGERQRREDGGGSNAVWQESGQHLNGEVHDQSSNRPMSNGVADERSNGDAPHPNGLSQNPPSPPSSPRQQNDDTLQQAQESESRADEIEVVQTTDEQGAHSVHDGRAEIVSAETVPPLQPWQDPDLFVLRRPTWFGEPVVDTSLVVTPEQIAAAERHDDLAQAFDSQRAYGGRHAGENWLSSPANPYEIAASFSSRTNSVRRSVRIPITPTHTVTVPVGQPQDRFWTEPRRYSSAPNTSPGEIYEMDGVCNVVRPPPGGTHRYSSLLDLRQLPETTHFRTPSGILLSRDEWDAHPDRPKSIRERCETIREKTREAMLAEEAKNEAKNMPKSPLAALSRATSALGPNTRPNSAMHDARADREATPVNYVKSAGLKRAEEEAAKAPQKSRRKKLQKKIRGKKDSFKWYKCFLCY